MIREEAVSNPPSRRKLSVPDPLIAVIVPAYNEARDLEATIQSLLTQTRRPGYIIVVSDSSTDHTPAIVLKYEAFGVRLIRTINNDAKKAGALNAGIRSLTQSGQVVSDIKYLLTMDGDTILKSDFVEKACRILERKDHMGGVSAACRGRAMSMRGISWPHRWLIAMQRIEYDRVAALRSINYVHTMSGAGSMYRTAALNDLLTYRQVFDTRPDNLVEDFETTIELRTLGWKVGVNEYLVAYTDLMPTLSMLIKQRERWVRGTLDELRRRGWTRATWYSKLQILIGALLIPVTYLMIAAFVWAIALAGGMDLTWYIVPLFLASFQVWGVRHLGWKYMMLEVILLPEIIFGIIRHYWFIRAMFRSRFSRVHSWG